MQWLYCLVQIVLIRPPHQPAAQKTHSEARSIAVWLYPPPPAACISYALVQPAVGVRTVIIVYVILITYEM